MQYPADGKVVDEGSSDTSNQGRDNWDPEVEVIDGKAFTTADEGHPQARAEVTSGVDGISGVAAEGCADGHDQEANDERVEVCLNGLVAHINNGKDQPNQQRGADEFVAERSKRSDKVLGVGVEHETRAFCSISNVGSTNKVVNGTHVDEVEDGCGDKRAKHLG